MVVKAIYFATLATVLTGLVQNVDAACKCVGNMALRSVYFTIDMLETRLF